jgi:hypothetical protein
MRCLICNRTLKDPESIARKIGPTCFNRLMKFTKEEKQKKKHRQEIKVDGKVVVDIPWQTNLFEELK